MIEYGTNYSFLVEALQPLTFQSVKALSDRFVSDLPKELQNKLFDELKQGGNTLETEPHLCGYLYAFGSVHESRLRKAYAKLPESFFEKEIELIDYGCGQAVGAMVYHDFLQEKNLAQSIRRITLIDPSERCLRRAALHVSRFFPKTEIRIISKYLNNLQAEDIRCEKELHKLHLFFNIPGMDISSVEHLTNVINANLSGYNQFVCTGPFYGESSEGMTRLDTFIDRLNLPTEAVFAEDAGENKFVPDTSWTIALRVFAKDENKPLPDVHSSESVEYPEPPIPTRISKPEEPCEVSPQDKLPVDTEDETRKIDKILSALNEPEESEDVRNLRAAAEGNDMKAQNKLGYLYDVGKEVLQNDAEAVRWYRRAAAQGYAMAQYNLGNHYLSGRGVPQDYVEAIKWYREAAEHNILPAMNNLGVIYATGQGVERNEAEAIKWYRKAAEQGDKTALKNLKKRGLSI